MLYAVTVKNGRLKLPNAIEYIETCYLVLPSPFMDLEGYLLLPKSLTSQSLGRLSILSRKNRRFIRSFCGMIIYEIFSEGTELLLPSNSMPGIPSNGIVSIYYPTRQSRFSFVISC